MPKLKTPRAPIYDGYESHDSYHPTRHPVDPGRARTRAIHEALRDLHGVELIYAIRCKDGLIKIGWTRDLMSRRRHFASSDTPEAILAIKPGTHAEEQAIHARLHRSVARGVEYYHPTAEVLAYVNGLRTDLGVEAIAA